MTALQARDTFAFHGVGGQDMQAAGLRSRFDMAELTVMGLSEVLPRLPALLRRIRETAEDVIARRPEVLITIDSPDFTLRVAARARRALPDLKVVHYVAPSVWAWRAGRAAKMARYVDHVLALLPFEPPYMHAAGMTCDFVGHPVAGHPQPSKHEIAAWREARGLKPGRPTLLLALGSRKGEVRRLTDPFVGASVGIATRHLSDLAIISPLAETVAAEVRAVLDAHHPDALVVAPEATSEEKRLAFAAADAALCASGTVTLEIAAADTPMVAGYRTTRLTAAIARRLLKVNSANLINLVSGQVVVPELLQEFCTTGAITDALLPLLGSGEAGEAQKSAFAEVMETLGRGGPPPEERAADSVLAFLRGDARIPHEKGPGLEPPGPRIGHEGRR